MVHWQTIKPVSVTSWRTSATHYPGLWTHPNSSYSSVSDQSSRSQWITERNVVTQPVHAWLSVSKKLTFAFSSTRFRCDLWLKFRSIANYSTFIPLLSLTVALLFIQNLLVTFFVLLNQREPHNFSLILTVLTKISLPAVVRDFYKLKFRMS